jgi:syntaxin-binding protein 5
MKWPLTGGVPSEMSLKEDCAVERIYVAGYQDGSVRIWDATFPILVPMFVLDAKVTSDVLLFIDRSLLDQHDKTKAIFTTGV